MYCRVLNLRQSDSATQTQYKAPLHPVIAAIYYHSHVMLRGTIMQLWSKTWRPERSLEDLTVNQIILWLLFGNIVSFSFIWTGNNKNNSPSCLFLFLALYRCRIAYCAGDCGCPKMYPKSMPRSWPRTLYTSVSCCTKVAVSILVCTKMTQQVSKS